MTRTSPWIAAVVLAFASALAAHADPITGTISISGNDTFNQTGITFRNGDGTPPPITGTVYQASGTLAAFAPFPVDGFTAEWRANLTSFEWVNANGTTIFTTANDNTGQTASFTITNLISHAIGDSSNGPTLALSGEGFFTESGYSPTQGTFSLTSSSAGMITGFQLVADVASTPEPGSLLLLGTGMTGMVGGWLRRRRSMVQSVA